MQRHGEHEVAGNLTQEIDTVETGGEPHEKWKFQLKVYQQLFGLDVGRTPPELLRQLFDGSDEIWDDRLERDGNTETGSPDLTIGAQVDRWTETQLARVRAGERSAAGYANDLVCLHHFRESLGAGTSVRIIDEGRWTAFYGHLLEMVGERASDPGAKAGWSRDYANKVFRVARSFVRWLWESGRLETLPKNLESSALRIGTTVPVITPIPVADVRRMVDEALGSLRCHLLLMLNCGFTQQDISDLHPSEVDWTEGRITRKRSKTRREKSVPTVTYKLWPTTLHLLRQYRQDGDRVLLTETGLPLVHRRLEGSEAKAKDAIAMRFWRLRARLKIGFSLKQLRKTSATMLENHPEYGRYAQFFLGDAARGITERHYVAPSVERFDRAIVWLGEQYGL